jgi:hypothetical protein
MTPIVCMSRPCGVVVSAHVSANDLKPAPAFAPASDVTKARQTDGRSDGPISVGVQMIRPTGGTNRMVTMLSELRFLGIRSAKL